MVGGYWLDESDESIVVGCGTQRCKWRLLCWDEEVGVRAVLAHRAAEHDYVLPRIGPNAYGKTGALVPRKARSIGRQRIARGCSVPGCNGIHYAKGKCRSDYYKAWYKTTKLGADQTGPESGKSQRQTAKNEPQGGFSGTGDSPRSLSAPFLPLIVQDKP